MPASSRLLRILAVVLLMAAAVAVRAAGAPAQSGGSPSAKRLAEIRAVLADARASVDEVAEAERRSKAALAEAEAASRRATAELRNATAQRVAAQEQAAAAAAGLARARASVAERARTLYISGGTGELAMVTSADDPDQLLDRMMRAEQQARAENEVMPELATAEELATGATERLAADEARAAAAARAATARAGELRAVARVRTEAKRKLAAKIADFQRQEREVQADSKRVEQLLQARGGPAEPLGPPSAAGLRAPVSCPRTSGFGYRWGRMHEGIDFGCPSGTPVAAAAAGTVVSAGWSNGYGNLVLVDHGSIVTAYAHNSRFTVGAGDRVAAGQTIALSGSTGRSTGPHVHFEVRVGGVARNPSAYLP
jgi:murein DD-endopeptidase MepM/ murein hydrolase activator NlpD